MSITWTTPFVASTSVTITLASLILRGSNEVTVISKGQPPSSRSVGTVCPTIVASVLMTVPLTPWYNKTFLRASLSASKASIVPAGRSSKALFVGAKTVKGPGPDRASPRPAATTASTSVDRILADWAISTML